MSLLEPRSRNPPRSLEAAAPTAVPATPAKFRAMARPMQPSPRALLLAPAPEFPLAGSVPLRRARSFLVPNEPGVYLIHDLRGVLYAGRTTRLQRRFEEHRTTQSNELLVLAQRSAFGALAFSWALVSDGRRRAQLERALVSWLQPVCNRVTPDAPT